MLNEMALSQVPDRIMTQNEAMQYSYVRLTELSRCWLVTQSPIWMNMSDLYVGLYNTSIPVSTLFVSDGKEIAVYVGTHLDKVDILMGLLRGTFPQARYASEYGSGDKIFSFNEASIAARACTYGGFIKGNPTGNENFMSMSQIDGIIKGMSHKPWIISVFAQPVPKGETLLRQQQWLTTASECSAFSQLTYTDNDNVETITYKKNYCHGEQFCEKVNSFCEKANESFSMGEWCVTVNFKSTTPSNSRLLGGLFTAAFYGEH